MVVFTHLGGNAERSASSICRPKGTSVSVVAARTRTVRTTRGAFVPAGTGARRRWGTGARRAPDIVADIIADISHSCVVGPDTDGASLRCVGSPLLRHSIHKSSRAGEGRVPIEPRADEKTMTGSNRRKKNPTELSPQSRTARAGRGDRVTDTPVRNS